MAKTEKELAFLRDLYIQDEWTRRFAEVVDKHMDLSDSENMLYINAGTGGHAIAISERFGEKTDIFASCENEELLMIARDKGAAVRSAVDFSTLRFEDDSFDAVLADASFVRPDAVEDFIEDAARVARTGGDVAVYLPSAGSFGEVFSIMWEALIGSANDEIDPAAVERLISELPTVTAIEEIASRSGLVNINTQTTSEIFSYENGKEFIEAPLIADFLLPAWLDMLDDERKEQVAQQLAQIIDTEDGDISFIFTVKATLLTGEKG